MAGDSTGAVAECELLLIDRQRVLGPDHTDTLVTRGNVEVGCAASGGAARRVEVGECRDIEFQAASPIRGFPLARTAPLSRAVVVLHDRVLHRLFWGYAKTISMHCLAMLSSDRPRPTLLIT